MITDGMIVKINSIVLFITMILFHANASQLKVKASTDSAGAPNIVIILADDMGKECLGTYGNAYKTPNLDLLAEKGLKFNYAFSQPLCSPSRVELMTGKYNYKNYVEFGYLDPYQKTFANLAKQAGYVTAIAGKWQLGANGKLPQLFGFDQYCLWQVHYKKKVGERYAKPLIEQDGRVLSSTDDDYGPDVFVNYVLDFITKNKDRKFLVYYPMVLVHEPFLPTPDSKNWADGSAIRHQTDTSNFKNMVAYTDKMVGKVISRLKELNLYDNTIIIFTGDNGTDQKIITTMEDGAKVPGGKGMMLDRGNHVPLIVNWGTDRYQLHETDDLFDFTDLLPTVADIVGEKVPADWNTDGYSIFPKIKGEKGYQREWIFSHYDPLLTPDVNQYAGRSFQNHHYKLYQDGRFYDLKADIEEQHPIAKGKGSAEAEKVRALFEHEFAKLPAWKPHDPGKPKRIMPGYEPGG